MSREKEFDVEQISGHQFMDEGDKEYFEKFGFAMSEQAELLAEQYDINSETMSDSFDFLMDSLVYRTNEYIVDGAPLNCSLQTNITQKLTYQDKEIVSEPVEIEEMSTLQLPENRQESVNGLAFANVEDAKGGMRDEKEAIENETDNVNIVSFGNCGCLERDNLTKVEDLAKNVHKILSEKNKEITVAEVEEKVISAIKQGKGTCYCCMLLNPEWENLPVEYDYMMNSFYPELPSAGVSKILESESYMQFNGKEGINMMSMLFCMRGGIISAKESGQNKYQNEMVINDWLILYTNPTVLDIGRHVLKHPDAKTYDWGMEEELKGSVPEQGMLTANSRVAITEAGGNPEVYMTSNNLYTDAEGRYWVAVGPNVMNPNHRVDEKISVDEMKYGTKIDIVVLDETTNITYYIPAVVGDVKNHSSPDGLYQTGVPFSSSGTTVVGDGSTVEFMGYDIVEKSVNLTNNYKLIEMIVYDGVTNY